MSIDSILLKATFRSEPRPPEKKSRFWHRFFVELFFFFFFFDFSFLLIFFFFFCASLPLCTLALNPKPPPLDIEPAFQPNIAGPTPSHKHGQYCLAQRGWVREKKKERKKTKKKVQRKIDAKIDLFFRGGGGFRSKSIPNLDFCACVSLMIFDIIFKNILTRRSIL